MKISFKNDDFEGWDWVSQVHQRFPTDFLRCIHWKMRTNGSHQKKEEEQFKNYCCNNMIDCNQHDTINCIIF